MNKDKLIRFRCTDDQHKAITDAAKAANKTLTDYILTKLDCSHKLDIVATKQDIEPQNVATKVEVVATKSKSVATKKEPQQASKSWAEVLRDKRRNKSA